MLFIVLLFLFFTVNALAESGLYRLAPAETYHRANDYSGPYYSPENQRKRQQEQRGYYGYDDDSRPRYRHGYPYHGHSYWERPPSKPTPQVTPKPKPTPKVYRYYH